MKFIAVKPTTRWCRSFLAGRAKKTVGNIISEWMAHPDGRIPAYSPNSDLMYSTTIPYTDIGPVRAALTSFSTQTIGKKVATEAESAVKLSNGLHVSIGKKHPEMRLRREDIGDETIPRVQSVIENHQPVILYLCQNIVMRKSRKQDGVIIQRKARPADAVIYSSHIASTSIDHPAPQVITHAISSLDFCRTDRANLLSLIRGILYLAPPRQ
jgi:hypothetical protein